MKKILIASKNSVKISSIKIGFEKMFSTELFEYEGFSADFGVSD